MMILEKLVPHGSISYTQTRRLLDIAGEKIAAVTAWLTLPMGADMTHGKLISQHLHLGYEMKLSSHYIKEENTGWKVCS